MSLRVLLALILLSVLPLVLLGWISTAAIRAEEARARETLDAYFQQNLVTFVAASEGLLEQLQKELTSSLDSKSDLTSQLGALRRRSPLVKLTFLVDSDGVLLYPDVPEQVEPGRAEDFLSIDQLVRNRPIQETAELKRKTQKTSEQPPVWMPWYQEQGLQLVLWIPMPSNVTAGILLNRTAWMSRFIADLPDNQLEYSLRGQKVDFENSLPVTRTRLVDSQNATIYQWGSGISGGQEQEVWFELADAQLSGPLSAWRVKYESAAPISVSSSSMWPTLLGLAAIGMLFVLLGIYVATSMRREMRLAAQHVSFAGQVSHELRTPLTNIRLYAEMAQEELSRLLNGSRAKSDTSQNDSTLNSVQRRLNVIETETQRLSRLCSSVLELLRHPHQTNSKIDSVNVGECIGSIVDQFRPSLEQAGVQIEVTSLLTVAVDANTLKLNREALEMVLMNLIGNVEKYASNGKWLSVRYRVSDSKLIVDVEDHGSGIPYGKREAIFKPFVRLDSSINAPSGTGIGLSIARQAARRAGGELKLKSSVRGATFGLELPIA